MRFSRSSRHEGCETREWHRHLVAFSTLVALVAFLGYARRAVKTIDQVKTTSPPPPLDHASANLALDGGFCPATSCKIAGGRDATATSAIREAFRSAPDAANAVRSNASNRFIATRADGKTSFEMLIRDPAKDTFISGVLARGSRHDEPIHRLVARCLRERDGAVFVDVGANIGYFTATALALGATTISFEPFYENAGALMSTIEHNHWKIRSTLYMNTLGYEANRVTMEPTHAGINLSNMHITGSHCAASDAFTTTGKRYGIDYMDGVSLDQVMMTNHRDVRRVQLMKIDVETFEMQVLNGAMHTLCNVVVERIVLEVQYLKPEFKLDIPCDFAKMRDTLVRMNYEIRDVKEETDLGSVDLPQLPVDVVFRLKDATRSPADALRGKVGNPCQKFDFVPA